MESFQLEYENVIELALVTFGDEVEEGRRLFKEEKDPVLSKELNEELYEVKISCTIRYSGREVRPSLIVQIFN